VWGIEWSRDMDLRTAWSTSSAFREVSADPLTTVKSLRFQSKIIVLIPSCAFLQLLSQFGVRRDHVITNSLYAEMVVFGVIVIRYAISDVRRCTCFVPKNQKIRRVSGFIMSRNSISRHGEHEPCVPIFLIMFGDSFPQNAAQRSVESLHLFSRQYISSGSEFFRPKSRRTLFVIWPAIHSLPWSPRIERGTPNQLKTCSTSIFAIVSASLLLSGKASAHFVKESIQVNIHRCP